MRGLLVALAFLSVAAGASAQLDSGASPAPHPGLAYATTHRTVSTHNPDAQRAFDEGLTLLYAFNPDQARRAFQQAATLDGGLAMAQWGIALSYGININTSYDPAGQRHGHDAIVQAQARAANASDVERALIDAAAKRYAYMGPHDGDASAHAYRDAMRNVARAFPNDDDVLTIAAESALDVQPWGQWSADGKPAPGTDELVSWLRTVLARNPQHIGANHLLIHAMEASPTPQEALEAAKRLAADNFEPAAEHLTHMPAHTFMRVGDYDAAARSNLAAMALFNDYLGASHEAGHESYMRHDCAFAVAALMMAGEYKQARKAADACGTQGRRLGAYAAIRFRRWADLAPAADVTTFAHGMSAVAAGRLDQATADVKTLERDKSDTSAIGARVVLAKVDAASGKRDDEIAELVTAVSLQDHLGYSEPPEWFFPVRESLGGAYFAAGRYSDAERTFREDLKRNPRNPRSLYGLSETLEREGRTTDAASAQAAFAQAWKHADASLTMDQL